VGKEASDLVLQGEAIGLSQKLGAATVSLDELEVSEGHWDSLFDRHRAALLRPDRRVFGVVDTRHDSSALVIEVAERLHLRGT